MSRRIFNLIALAALAAFRSADATAIQPAPKPQSPKLLP